MAPGTSPAAKKPLSHGAFLHAEGTYGTSHRMSRCADGSAAHRLPPGSRCARPGSRCAAPGMTAEVLAKHRGKLCLRRRETSSEWLCLCESSEKAKTTQCLAEIGSTNQKLGRNKQAPCFRPSHISSAGTRRPPMILTFALA